MLGPRSLLVLGCMLVMPSMLGCASGCDSRSSGTQSSSATASAATAAASSCRAEFTPHKPGSGGCIASQTICRKGPKGPRCRGSDIIIPCGHSGERCGKSFHCDCRKAGAKKKP